MGRATVAAPSSSILLLLCLSAAAAADHLLPNFPIGEKNSIPQKLEVGLTTPTTSSSSSRAGAGAGGSQRGCWYTVSIKTSCSSRRITRDAISLFFGDAYGYEVYAPRLDDPSSGAFERCSTDTFQIQGPCTYRTCYLYLQRNGRDGWTPDWVKVTGPSSSWTVTFNYQATPLPNGVWYGFNLCPRHSHAAAATSTAAA